MPQTDRNAVPDTSRPPRGFAPLAGRISVYTSRVALSAVVVIAGIGFARQVLHWWRDDAAEPYQQPPGAALGIGHPSAAHEVTVGDQPWSILRQTVRGDAAAASRTLLDASQSVASETGGVRLPAPGPEQRELLARLADSTPARQTPGGVSLYALPDGFPMVVGTRSQAGGPAVATWGIAVPTTPTDWSLYTFFAKTGGWPDEADRPAGRHDGQGIADSPQAGLQPPLPPGCRRLLQVRAMGGATSIAFAGPSRPAEWKRFYDGWAAEAGLQDDGGWRESNGAWHNTYRSATPNRQAVVEIHFHQGRGVVLLARAPDG